MKSLKLITLFAIYLVITISFSLYIPKVSAQEQACCQRTIAGDFCRYTDTTDCDLTYEHPANIYCENLDFCKTGCCYDPTEGSCHAGVPRAECEAEDSIWNSDPLCDIEQCQLGCCQLSNQCSLATQVECSATASKYPGVEMIFHSTITDEQSCKDQCRGTEEGACISEDKSCTRTTRGECQDTFHLNKLCSNPDLGTNCARQQTTACVGEDAYWFDSCGNKENIYNKNERISYNSGYIQREELACPEDSPDCGNCDYITGTLCGENKGGKPDYICKDMNCENVYKNTASPNSGGYKKHGESWCIYDTGIGPGKDVVGSRYRIHYCLNGEELIEECADFREQYCVQNIIGDKILTDISLLELISTDLQGYTEAQCIENTAVEISCMDCINEETLEKQQECCSDLNKDCYWVVYGKPTGILPNGVSTANGICVPLFPPGSRFWEAGEPECSKATQTCKIKEESTDFGRTWSCVDNCQCREHDWVVSANKYCKAMGDCGAYYNVEGKLSIGGFTLQTATTQQLSPSDFESWKSLQNPAFDEIFEVLSKKTNKEFAEAQKAWGITFGTAGLILGLAAKVMVYPGPGYVVAVVLLVIATILYLGSKERTKTYILTCEPWEAPDGGRDCEKCNDLDIECTEYRCKSLGKDCELVNEGTEDQMCVSSPITDTSSPFITPGEMDFKITPEPPPITGFKIKDKIPAFTPLTLKVNTDELAKCKYSTEPLQPFETMEPFGTSSFKTKHEVIIPILSEETMEQSLIATPGEDYELYIKCRDSHDPPNINKRDYSIKFRIQSGPDLTPPSIDKTLPDNKSPIPYDKKELDITLLLNEPSDCKWSLQDKDYEQMENPFTTCAKNELDFSPLYYGLYECKTKLTDIQQNQLNTFYFRCQDKANNIQQQSEQFSLLSTPPLEILDTKPVGKVYTKYPVLEVTTAQGSNNGIATCGFNEQDVTLTNMLQMFNTESTDHSQQLPLALEAKQYTYYIKCVDNAGNIAEEIVTFKAEVSLEAPQIYNIYKSRDILHISTTEDTTCQYSEKSFTFGTGTAMTQLDSKEHTTTLGQNTYHIICQDKFNNQESAVIYP